MWILFSECFRSICQMVDQIRIFREHEYGFEPDYELQSLICRRLHELSDRDLHTVAAAHDNNFRRVVSNAAGLQGTWRKVKVKLQSRTKWNSAKSEETHKLPNVCVDRMSSMCCHHLQHFLLFIVSCWNQTGVWVYWKTFLSKMCVFKKKKKVLWYFVIRPDSVSNTTVLVLFLVLSLHNFFLKTLLAKLYLLDFLDMFLSNVL